MPWCPTKLHELFLHVLSLVPVLFQLRFGIIDIHVKSDTFCPSVKVAIGSGDRAVLQP